MARNHDTGAVTLFENVVEEYDRGRPAYPDALYDELGPFDGLRVVEVGAGTGIATRQLLERGANVVAFDAGPAVLAQAKARTPELAAVVADGARLPLGDGAADLVCVAQAWHWLDPSTRTAEMRRVLRSGGRLATWWSHPRVDDAAWLGDYWSVIEATCDGAHRSQAQTDWGPTLADGGHLRITDVCEFDWLRHVSVDDWITDQSSHSYVATLAEPTKSALLAALRSICTDTFADGLMRIPFVTRLWAATKA